MRTKNRKGGSAINDHVLAILILLFAWYSVNSIFRIEHSCKNSGDQGDIVAFL